MDDDQAPDATDPREEEDQLLWEARYDDKAVEDLEGAMTEYQKSGQLQQRPSPKEGVQFKREHFQKRWNEHNIPSKFRKVIDCWDLTFTGGQKHRKSVDGKEKKIAFNVGYKLGLHGPDIYVLWEIRKKMGIKGQLTEIPRLRSRHDDTREIIIEKAANGQAAADLLKEKIPGVILITPSESKEDRAEAQEHFFDGGNIIFPEDMYAPWVAKAIEEIISFGPKAKYKDRVDALVHGIERLGKLLQRVSFDADAIGDHTKKSGWTLN